MTYNYPQQPTAEQWIVIDIILHFKNNNKGNNKKNINYKSIVEYLKH